MEFPVSFALPVSEIEYEKPLSVPHTAVGSSLANPYFVHVDSDTDLGVAIPSFAGVVVALVAAVITLIFQKRQIRANITNFRHQWMVELRACLAEYMQVLYSTADRLTSKEGYAESDDYLVVQEKLAILTFKFELLLSRDDEATKEIFELDKQLCRLVYRLKFGDDLADFFVGLYKLRDLFRLELESAWVDVQVDLSARKVKKFRGNIRKRISSVLKIEQPKTDTSQ